MAPTFEEKKRKMFFLGASTNFGATGAQDSEKNVKKKENYISHLLPFTKGVGTAIWGRRRSAPSR